MNELKTCRRTRIKRFSSGSLALLFTLSAVNLGAFDATPAVGAKIEASFTEPSNPKLKMLHLDVPNLPKSFHETQPDLHYYYYIGTDGVNRAIYCIEIQNHTWSLNPSFSDTPTRVLSAEQQTLIKHVLLQGREAIDVDDDDVVKNYSAVQIAIWLIAEDFYKNKTVLDAVLFPATGNYPDTAGFAQTLEIGRLSRSFLNYAIARAAGPQKLQPSFASDSPSTAPTYKMKAVGSSYEVSLEDKDLSLGDNWFAGRLKIADAAGHKIAVFGNTMTVTGSPSTSTLITLKAEEPVGKLRYLKQPTYQEAIQFVYSGLTTTQYYFKVEAPTTPTTPTSTPSVSPSATPSTTSTPSHTPTPSTTKPTPKSPLPTKKPNRPLLVTTGGYNVVSRGLLFLAGGIALMLCSGLLIYVRRVRN